jgi:hypothetical protein
MTDMTLQLERDAFGRLVWTDIDGARHVGVVPVRAFPISAPSDGLSLVGQDGKECLWIARLDELSADARALIVSELGNREFMPAIQRINSVSTYSTPSIWVVDTDRGTTELVLKGEEDIRRLPDQRLLISDQHGIQYMITDRLALDRHSRRILDRFL